MTFLATIPVRLEDSPAPPQIGDMPAFAYLIDYSVFLRDWEEAIPSKAAQGRN